MPIYEFKCTKCNVQFELKRPMSQAGVRAKCPNDGAEGRRLWSASLGARIGGKSRKLGTENADDSSAPPPAKQPQGHSHGHSHGGHSHGPGGHSH